MPNLVAHHHLLVSLHSISTAVRQALSAKTLFKILHMSPGRPKWSRNKASHSTGGARVGSGRKKHDIILKFYIGPQEMVGEA